MPLSFSFDYKDVNSIEKINIDNDVYLILLRLLKSKTGLNFEYYTRIFIEKRIKARMIRVKCNTLDEYYKYLFSNDREFRKFLDSFPINYTFFFRDWEVYDAVQNIFLECLNWNKEKIMTTIKPTPSQLNKFRTETNYLKHQSKESDSSKNVKDPYKSYLTQMSLYKKHANAQVNIWSCPCSSGEEPYTIAMILDNLSKQIPLFPRFKIVGSDIDADAIIKAITGIYSEDSMKEITDFYKTKYFQKIKRKFGTEYIISEDVKKHMEFVNEDITNVHQKPYTYDIIFCRYLLIYFNRENRDKFMNIIKSRLNRGGLLILGKTETLFNSSEGLKQIDSNNQIYLKTR